MPFAISAIADIPIKQIENGYSNLESAYRATMSAATQWLPQKRRNMDKQSVSASVSVIRDLLKDIDRWSVYHDDLVNKEIARIREQLEQIEKKAEQGGSV